MNTLIFIWHHSSSRVLELLPWFMLAVVLGRLLQSMRLDVLTGGGLRRRNATAIVGTTLFGSLTPFCACAIVPIIRSVLRAGVPLSVVMAFWISSPAMAPEEFGLTAKVFGLKLALVRLAGAIALGIAAALVAKFLESRGILKETSKELVAEKAAAAETCCTATRAAAAAPVTAHAGGAVAAAGDPAVPHGNVLTLEPVATATVTLGQVSTAGTCCGTSGTAGAASSCCPAEPLPGLGTQPAGRGWFAMAMQSLRQIQPGPFARGLLRDTWSLGRWMLLGILVEALVTRFVPAAMFGGLLGGHDLVLAVFIAGLLSVPLYLNGVSAIPIGLALMNMGLNPAALLTFLLAGSITTIPALAGVRSVVTGKVFALYVATGVIGPMIIGLLAAPVLH